MIHRQRQTRFVVFSWIRAGGDCKYKRIPFLPATAPRYYREKIEGKVAGVFLSDARDPLNMITFFILLLLTVGTIYGKVHYAIDALAGAVLAILVFFLDETIHLEFLSVQAYWALREFDLKIKIDFHTKIR